MRVLFSLLLIAVLTLAQGCEPATAPAQCFRQGDTVGWITVVKRENGDTIAHEPLEAEQDFCL